MPPGAGLGHDEGRGRGAPDGAGHDGLGDHPGRPGRNSPRGHVVRDGPVGQRRDGGQGRGRGEFHPRDGPVRRGHGGPERDIISLTDRRGGRRKGDGAGRRRRGGGGRRGSGASAHAVVADLVETSSRNRIAALPLLVAHAVDDLGVPVGRADVAARRLFGRAHASALIFAIEVNARVPFPSLVAAHVLPVVTLAQAGNAGLRSRSGSGGRGRRRGRRGLTVAAAHPIPHAGPRRSVVVAVVVAAVGLVALGALFRRRGAAVLGSVAGSAASVRAGGSRAGGAGA